MRRPRPSEIIPRGVRGRTAAETLSFPSSPFVVVVFTTTFRQDVREAILVRRVRLRAARARSPPALAPRLRGGLPALHCMLHDHERRCDSSRGSPPAAPRGRRDGESSGKNTHRVRARGVARARGAAHAGLGDVRQRRRARRATHPRLARPARGGVRRDVDVVIVSRGGPATKERARQHRLQGPRRGPRGVRLGGVQRPLDPTLQRRLAVAPPKTPQALHRARRAREVNVAGPVSHIKRTLFVPKCSRLSLCTMSQDASSGYSVMKMLRDSLPRGTSDLLVRHIPL